MDELSKFIYTLGFYGGYVIFAVFLGTMFGAVSGWIMGWFFSETILNIFAAFGVKGFTMWEVGAFLGFISGYFTGGKFHGQSKKAT